MSTFTVQQIEAAMNAPVEHPTGPRSSKVIAAARIASPINAANAAKQRKRRIAAEKKEAVKQRKLDRAALKAQKVTKSKVTKSKVTKPKKVVKPMTAIAKQAAKQSKVRRKSIREAKKSHTTFKKSLKATRSQLNLKWKEEAKALKAVKKAEKEAEAAEKKAVKAAKKAAREEAIVAKKAAKASKPPTPKKATLTDEQKHENKARRAYKTEMNRRAKWGREFKAKFEGAYTAVKTLVIEETDLEDAFVC
jgi:hypothetical protein